MLGGMNICTLGLGFVASLAITLQVHHCGKFEISFAIPNYK